MQGRIGKGSIRHTTVFACAIGAEAEFIRTPDRGLVYSAEKLQITLLVPVRHSTSVATFILEKLLMKVDEEPMPGEESTMSDCVSLGGQETRWTSWSTYPTP